jgi:hypothetical protein
MLVATLALFVAAAPTATAMPAWEEVIVDDTFYLPRTSAACGFDVLEHDEGQLKFQVIEMANGTLRFKDLASGSASRSSPPRKGQAWNCSQAAGIGRWAGAGRLSRPSRRSPQPDARADDPPTCPRDILSPHAARPEHP